MTPQFVDLNDDGFDDMVMGTYEGVAWQVRGGKDGFGQPERILDANERPVLVSLYWGQ